MKNLFSNGLCAALLVCASFASPILAQSPTDNATTPTTDAAEVVSVYGGSYTSIASNLNPGWGQSGSVNPAFDPGTGDLVMLYSNFNYQGTDLATTDLSGKTHLHLDVWVAPGTDRLLKVTPVNSGGSGSSEFLVNVPLTPGTWNSVDLAKSDFTGMTWDNVIQMKFDGQFNGDGSANGTGWDVYLDNIYFYGTDTSGGGGDGGGDPVAATPTDNAAAPTVDAANVISVFSDSYTDIASNYNPSWGQSGTVATDFDPGTGNLVMLYSNLNYQGTDLATTDASAMGYLHVDVWVAPGTDRLLKVTPVNNASGGSGVAEFLVNVPLTPGSWNSVDLPKSAFTGMTWDNVFQMKFDGQFNGDGTANGAGYDVYLDNIYFWEDTSAPVSGCMDSNATNYVAEATVDDGTCTYNVTFRVDMANFTGASYGGVFINGTFNSWCGTCNPMTDADQDGVWEVTLPLTAGAIEYKFTLDGWTQQEEFQPGGSCTVTNNGFTNRALTIDGVEDLSVVCWNTCDACLLAPGCMDSNAVNYDSSAQADDGSCLYTVTFQVDMANYDLPAGATVFTNGTYNGWCGGCNAMSDGDADGIWTGTFNLPAGDQEYKFTINGWDDQEYFNGYEACTTAPAEYVNRVSNISGPTTLPVVCWNTCDACADITNTTLGTGHATLQGAIDAASAGNVIEVAAGGTYAESLTIDKGLSIDGNGSTLDVSGLGVGISIQSDVDGVTIDNLTIVGDASTYSGITVNPGASNVSILNNNISGMALSNPGNSSPLSYGILCWGNTDPVNPPTNVLIDGNEIHGVSGTAISLGDNTEGVTISNNHFHSIGLVTVNGAPWSSGVVAGQANNLAISGNNMEGLGYASVLTACTGVTLDLNQYTGGTSLLLLASLPNSILPDAADWWSLEAAAIGYIYYFNSAAAQGATDAGLQAVGIPTVLSSSNPGCMEADACNFDSTALSEDGSCTYPPATYFDCNGACENDADGDGICDELEGLIPELETACGANTVWDPALGQCIMNAECIGDVDLDGHIGSTDLLYLLGNFGTFCQDNGGE